MMLRIQRGCAVLWLYLIHAITAISLDIDDAESVKRAASAMAYGMMSYYKGNESGQTPGLLPQPYYWWESGAMLGSMVDYWHNTGDTTYNNLVLQGLQFQVGPNKDFMPPNASASLGNDDQAFWAMAALSAAETNFPNPPATDPSWLSLAQAVFNEQISRWDTTSCGGGIRWQIYQISGYDVKNTISNGCLFNIASRLARYTGDDMYAQWAIKIWDWLVTVGFIDDNYNVYDSAEAARLNCSQIDKNQWTYNAGTMLMGASTMFNYTDGSDLWLNRTQGLLKTLAYDFFPGGIMKDICEEYTKCNVDELSFKAYLSRWMAATTQMAPFTYDTVMGLLRSSAVAAAAQCTGAPTGQVCGSKWYLNGTWDGSNGVGQQMSAMAVLLGTLVKQTSAPLTNTTGGTSIGNPHAGYNASNIPPGEIITPATKADKAGAYILTMLILGGIIFGTWFIVSDSWEELIDPPPGMYEKDNLSSSTGRVRSIIVLTSPTVAVVEAEAGATPVFRGGAQVT